jgi:ABC-type Fe3+ transport system substrate-binding protein
MIYLTKEEILAGAKKEGRVVVSPGHDEQTAQALIQAFRKKYPFVQEVDWRNVQGSAGEQRQLLEIRAGRTVVDAFSPHQAFYNEYRKFNPFKRYDLRAMAEDGELKIPLDMIDDSGMVAWLGTTVGVILYNSKLVPSEKAPTGWESCIDPQWKGKLTVDTKPLVLVRLISRWGEEKLLAYAKRLKENEPIWSRGVTRSITSMLAGEFALFCGAYLHSTMRALKKDPGAPLKIVIPNPLSIGLTEPESIYANARNPHAGLLWIEFLASKEGQDTVESREAGRGSLLVEGTTANKLAKSVTISLCGRGCFDRADQMAERIAVEAWGLPKVQEGK